MGELEILQTLIGLFNKFHLSYLLTGGYAATYYGEPRATNDIDFVVEITEENKKKLAVILKHLSPNYIFDKSILSSISDRRTEFNLVHEATGIKIDFWVVPKVDFAREYKRRQLKKIGGLKVSLTSAEDLMLKKLSWCKEVFSERHFRDCLGIWNVQKPKLDFTYLKSEAKKRRIENLLTQVTQ